MRSSEVHDKKALVVVLTDVSNDPRVRRQIDWLLSEGWTVDSLGLGTKPNVPIRDHFALKASPAWTKTFLGLAAIHSLLPYRARFWTLAESRFPKEVVSRVRGGEYDLIILNDTHLIPWLTNKKTFPPDAATAHVHIDLHEYFSAELSPDTRGRFLLEGYHRWGRAQIANPVVASRSVAGGTAELYMEEFDIPHPVLVRNCPPFIQQSPSTVNPRRMELIHHGIAGWARGFKQMVDAMRLVDERFVLTFMLAGSERVIAELRAYASDLPERIKFVPPVPMVDLAAEVNKYDVEVMFFPPTTINLELTLPNKLFEAVQGRLGVVIGPTKMMVQVVEECGNGLVTPDWSAEALASTINSLTAEEIVRMKDASHAAAPIFNAEAEKANFLASLGNAVSE